MSEPVRIGIVGAGLVAQVAHLPLLSKLRGVEIAAICDTDLPKARSLAQRFDVPDVYDDIVDLFQLSRPDAVVVCTPNHLHKIHVQAALKAGVHVLCERPVALTSAGAEEVAKQQAEAGRVVMVGMNHRFRTDLQAIWEFLEGGELGSLRGIRCGWHTFQPPHVLGWRVHRAQSGGGAMFDLGLPLIDAALWLAEQPQVLTVSAHYGPSASDDVERTACVLLRCADDLSLFVDVSWDYVGDRETLWMDVVGTRGSAGISPLRVFKEINGKPMNVTPTRGAERENPLTVSYRTELGRFISMVRGEVDAPTLDEQIRLHRVMEAIERSAIAGHDIVL